MNLKSRWISVLAVILFSFSSLFADVKIRGTNRNYQQGEWITYGTTRFIRYISLGNEFVYFATTGGITRFNYYSNRWDFPWTISNGLADNNIFLVAQDSGTGYLWCVTEKSLSCLEPATKYWNNYFFDEMNLGNVYNGEAILSLGLGRSGELYVYTKYKEIYKTDYLFVNFDRVEESINNLTQQNQIKWFGGALEPQRGEMPFFFLPQGYLLDKDNLFISDLNFRDVDITYWIRDSWQNLWVATWGLGAARGDMNVMRMELLPYGLWDETVDAVIKDEDALWVGGIQQHDDIAGITEFYENDEPVYYEPHFITGFDNDRISSIASNGKAIWFGTDDGITKFNKHNNKWTTLKEIDNLIDNKVTDIVVYGDNLFVSTLRGVSHVYTAAANKDSAYINDILYKSLGEIKVYDLELQKNLLWMATEFGIFIYDIETEKGGYYKGAIGPSDRQTFAVSHYQDEVWFGTEDGVAAFNVETKTWLKPPAKLYETDAEIYKILADKDAVWVATNQGVLKYNRFMGRWTQFTVEDGLPSQNVYSLMLDGDYIWFGTDQGLTKFYWNSPYRTD